MHTWGGNKHSLGRWGGGGGEHHHHHHHCTRGAEKYTHAWRKKTKQPSRTELKRVHAAGIKKKVEVSTMAVTKAGILAKQTKLK